MLMPSVLYAKLHNEVIMPSVFRSNAILMNVLAPLKQTKMPHFDILFFLNQSSKICRKIIQVEAKK